MEHPAGGSDDGFLQLDFDRRLKLEESMQICGVCSGVRRMRWAPLVGQFGGFAKLGSGSCQAANFAVSSPPAPIAA